MGVHGVVPRTARALTAALALLSASCLRSIPEIPAPPSGVVLIGEVARSSGEAAPGARVELLGTTHFALADALGRFRFERLPLGARLHIGVRATPRGPLAVVLDPLQPLVDAQVVDLGRIQLGAAGVVEAVVVREDAEGRRAAAGATCVLLPDRVHGIADDRGVWRLNGVAEGVHELACWAPELAPARVSGLRVVGSGTVRAPEVVLRAPSGRTGTIEVQAFLADGGAASNARVSLTAVDGEARGNGATDALGTARLTAAPGAYRLDVERTGYAPATWRDVVVFEDETTIAGPIVLLPSPPGDRDGDGLADGDDLDRDGDGCADAEDALPDDARACDDADGDGVPDSAERDADGDGLLDAEENTPGADGWVTHPGRADTDGDGVRDATDLCPSDVDPAQSDADADGRGDACDGDPAIVDVTPRAGGPGVRVAIRGRGLVGDDGFALVDFGGALAFPEVSAADLLEVRVPRGAASGPVRVWTRGGTATSSIAFVVDEGPSIFELRPPWTVPGVPVQVIGRGFASSMLRATVGGVLARTSSVTALPDGRTQLLLAVDSVVTGPVRLETAEGAATSGALLAVVERPEVTGIEPARAAPGDTVAIRGRGLDARALGAPVVIVFGGGATAAPLRVSDARIDVVVPASAASGPVEVRHPVATLLTPPLTIDGSAVITPEVSRIEPSAALAGQTVALIGRGLSSAAEVWFVGGAVPILGPGLAVVSDTRVLVTVPAFALPGPLEVRLADGRTLTTPRLARVAETAFARDARLIGGGRAGLGFGSGGRELFLLDARGRTRAGQLELTVLDGSTLAPLRVATVTIPEAAEPLAGFQVGPTGSNAVMWSAAQDLTWVLDLSTLALRGPCASRPLRGNRLATSTWVFGTLGASAYAVGASTAGAGNDAVLALQTINGACSLVASTTGTSVLASVAIGAELVVSHRTRGLGRFDPFTGFALAPYAVPISPHAHLLWDPDGVRLWGHGGAASMRFDGAQSPLVVGDGAAYADSNVAVSSSRRWVFYTGAGTGGTPAGILFDAQEGRVAGEISATARTAWGAARHPSQLVFATADERGGVALIAVGE